MAEDTSPRMAASGAMELARHAAFQKGTAYRFGQKKRAGIKPTLFSFKIFLTKKIRNRNQLLVILRKQLGTLR